MSKYLKIFLVFLILSSGVYLTFLSGIGSFIIDFKNNVLVFLPPELIFLFSLIGFGMIFQLYKKITE